MEPSGDVTPATFDDWLLTPCGRYVAEREQAIFDRVLPDLFGYYALQIGAASMPLLRGSRIGNRWCMGWNTVAEFLAEPDQLPFQENQFDVIVMPHTLEFHALPHEVLREAYRALRPEGRLLLTGFNPFSLYGVKRFLGRDRSGAWGGDFIALSRVKDWLTLLGFDLIEGQLDCFNVPAASERTLSRMEWVAKAGDQWWPFAGGVYYLQAAKRVAGVRLLKPEWTRHKRRRVAVTAPSREGLSSAVSQSHLEKTHHTVADVRHD